MGSTQTVNAAPGDLPREPSGPLAWGAPNAIARIPWTSKAPVRLLQRHRPRRSMHLARPASIPQRSPTICRCDAWAEEPTANRRGRRLPPARRQLQRRCPPRDRFPSRMPISNIGGGWTPINRRRWRWTRTRYQQRLCLPMNRISQAAFSAGWPRWRVSIPEVRPLLMPIAFVS